MFFTKEFPLERYIISLFKKYKYDIDLISAKVYEKYPFVKKNDLKKVVSELLFKKINKEKIGGKWIKIDNKWKLESINYNDLTHRSSGNYWKDAPVPSDVGRANRFWLSPQGEDPDKYKAPKESKKDAAKEAYEILKKRFKEAYPNLKERELKKIVYDEMKSLGYDLDLIK